MPADPSSSRGVRLALLAYIFWGFTTVYWKQLDEFAAIELIAHLHNHQLSANPGVVVVDGARDLERFAQGFYVTVNIADGHKPLRLRHGERWGDGPRRRGGVFWYGRVFGRCAEVHSDRGV